MRKPASKAMKPDPAFQELYVPRKKGDETGSSKLINDVIGTNFGGEADGPEAEAVKQNINQRPSSTVNIGAPTKFENVPITNNLQTAGSMNPGGLQGVDVEAYWTGLMANFRDPIIAEYLTDDNFVTPRVEKVTPT